jgi:hypothetical protein
VNDGGKSVSNASAKQHFMARFDLLGNEWLIIQPLHPKAW